MSYQLSNSVTAVAFDIHGVLLQFVSRDPAAPFANDRPIDAEGHTWKQIFLVRNKLLNAECPLCDDGPCQVTSPQDRIQHVPMAVALGRMHWSDYEQAVTSRARKHGYDETVAAELALGCRPEGLCSIVCPIQKGESLLTDAVAHVGSENVYILSNVSRHSLAHYREKFPHMFDVIPEKNMFISSDAGVMKPHPDIFQSFLSKYGLTPETCLFIDDSKLNVQVAREHGMQGHVFTGEE